MLRERLDTPMFLDFVYNNSFGKLMEEYSYWPNRNSKDITHKTFCLTSAIRERRDVDLLSGPCLSLLQRPEAYLPVASLMRENEEQLAGQILMFSKFLLFTEEELSSHVERYTSSQFREDLRSNQTDQFSTFFHLDNEEIDHQTRRFSSANTIDLSTYAYLRKVFQLQNYHIANNYFELAGIEPCEESFFQLSRYSSEFIELARHRSIVHGRINAALDDIGLPLKKTTLKFQDKKAFEFFLKKFCRTVLQHVSLNGIRGVTSWRTIAAFYAKRDCGTQNYGLQIVFVLHTLAKFLRERLHDRLTIIVGETKIKAVPQVRSRMVLFHEYAILADCEGYCKLMDSQALRRWGILRHQDDSKYIFDIQYMEHEVLAPDLGLEYRWGSAAFSPFSLEHTKALSRDHKIDIEEFSRKIIGCPSQFKSKVTSSLLFRKGDLVWGEFHNVVGMITRDVTDEDNYIEVSGFNSGHSSKYRSDSFRQIRPSHICNNVLSLQDFVRWLTRNDRFIQLAGVEFTKLTIDNGVFRLM